MLILLEQSAEDWNKDVRRVIDTAKLDCEEVYKEIIEGYRYDTSAPRILGLNSGDVDDGYTLFEATKLQTARYKLAGTDFSVLLDINERFCLGSSGDCNLRSVDIPYGVSFINELTFEHFPLLETVRIPPTVEFISEGAFRRCEKLKKVSFIGTSRLQRIDLGAFAFCSALEQIDLPPSLMGLDASVFEMCTHLKSISFGGEASRLRYIGTCCFSHCGELTTLSLPSSLKKLGSFVFENSGVYSLDLRLCQDLLQNLKVQWHRDIHSSGYAFMDTYDSYGIVSTNTPRSDAKMEIIALESQFDSYELQKYELLENIKITLRNFSDE